jgi:hypothetical protein
MHGIAVNATRTPDSVAFGLHTTQDIRANADSFVVAQPNPGPDHRI